MPRNGSGTFNRIYNWTTDAGNGIDIEASRMDGEFDGLATGLSNSIAKDGQTTITANIPFNSKKITALANGSARTDSVALGQVQDNSFGTLGTLGGSADTYTATPLPAITAYATGSEFNLKVNVDNTGASTLNVSAVAAKNIKKYDGAGSKIDLEAGDLQQDQYYKVIYDGTDFVLIGKNPATTSTAGQSLLPNPITISNGTDADHDIDFTAGNFNFDDGSGQAVATALTKQIDAAWVAGDNAGGLDTGTVAADTTYYCFVIWNPTTSTADFLFSTSVSSPTLPSGYTKKKRVGQILTDASSNISLNMIGVRTLEGGQVLSFKNGEAAIGSTIIPTDDTIPQITEGDEYMRLTIAPISATSKLLIEVQINLAISTAVTPTVALFKNSDSDAINCVSMFNGTNAVTPYSIRHFTISGATTATTFKVRAGGSQSPGSLTMNGSGGGRLFGGVLISSITITEFLG